ncbi:SCO family protein [Formosa maritima]|uniref:SCO family protein n=1 Tax=Formosa maritima TaxID=2592046 RepID=A0A5D0G8A4_9FLAO|nr:SCO family protein [Formosa maritima]TYA55168.1 SCO family protein [Formosa maritima]
MNNKSNYSYVGVAFIILVFGIIFIPKIINRISNNSIVEDDRLNVKNEKHTTKSESDLAFIEINGEAKKVPSFSFTNQNGTLITNTDYKGKVYIVEFFFTTCPTICPKMNNNLVQIQNTFQENEDFGIASFSINPEHDTIQVLKNYAEQYGITNPNWHLMTGEQADIYKLANQGFNLYTAQEDSVEGGFEHSGNFALIDKNGFIRSRIVNGNPLIYYNGIISEAEGLDDDGQEQQITMLKEDIIKLLNEKL